jgi:uncharacterized membrane protein YkvA (DUF1232 family)
MGNNIKEKINKQIRILAVAMKHPSVPWYAKLMIGITVAYALSPIDFIPVRGYLDDIVLIPVFIFI